MKVGDIPVSRRGRTVQLDSELVSDLSKIMKGRVQAYNLVGYFPGKDLGSTKVRQAIGQNIRKNWTHPEGVNADGKLLRLDFSADGIFARLSNAATVAEPETAEATA